MGRVNTPVLTEQQQAALENELKSSDNHTFRMRCQAILLKAAGRKSKDVGQIVGMCNVSVNAWLKRYKQTGLAGLRTKPGRGRKPGINKITDETAILDAVKANRQRISLAIAEWETQRPADSPTVGRDTFRNFLKVLVADANESADG
jgi:transposase